MIATELAGPLTVVLVTAEVLRTWMTELYEEIRGLGPCLVVLEEIDSVASKGSRGDTSFAEFLDALDGTRSSDDVLTVATTNDPEALDPAVKRPGRFDTIIEVPPPDRAGRTEILRLFLPPEAPVDVSLVASALDGATGADLREVARRSILEHGPDGADHRPGRRRRDVGQVAPRPGRGQLPLTCQTLGTRVTERLTASEALPVRLVGVRLPVVVGELQARRRGVVDQHRGVRVQLHDRRGPHRRDRALHQLVHRLRLGRARRPAARGGAPT